MAGMRDKLIHDYFSEEADHEPPHKSLTIN